jgi:hypothetical protein
LQHFLYDSSVFQKKNSTDATTFHSKNSDAQAAGTAALAQHFDPATGDITNPAIPVNQGFIVLSLS